MKRLVIGVLALLTALAGSVVLLAAPAGAGGRGHDRPEVTVLGAEPLFDFDGLYPGATLSADVRVTTTGKQAGALKLSAINVVDESVCSPVEVKSGMPCGEGVRGFLGDQVVFSVYELDWWDRTDLVWAGTIDELDRIQLAPSSHKHKETRTYRISAHLPWESGNETQADRLTFDFRFDLQGKHSSVIGSGWKHTWGSFLGFHLPWAPMKIARWCFGSSAGLLAGLVLAGVWQARKRGLMDLGLDRTPIRRP